MADVFPSIIAIVGGIALILAILIGIQLMFQKAANLSGRRHVIKVNGATLFDVRPERKYYPPPKQLSYNESPLSTYQSSFYKTRIFIYNPERKIIEIYYKH